MNKLMIGIVLIALAAGCSTDKVHEWMRAKPVEVTDFLPENERLERRADTFLVHYTWLDTNAVMAAQFKNVHIAPFDLSYLPKGNGYDTLRAERTPAVLEVQLYCGREDQPQEAGG